MKLVLKLMALSIFLFSQAAIAGKVDVEYHAVSSDMQLPFSEAVKCCYICRSFSSQAIN